MMISVLEWPTCSHNYGTENAHCCHSWAAQFHSQATSSACQEIAPKVSNSGPPHKTGPIGGPACRS